MSDPGRSMSLSCDDVREMAGAFVLGALEPAVEADVRAHLATCPDAHAEIAEVGAVLPVFDASVPQVEPPASLKSRIMAAVAADLEARNASVGTEPAAAVAPAAAEVSPRAATPVMAFPTAEERAVRATRRTTTLTWAMRIAAVLVIGVLAGWNVLLQGQLQTARTYEENVAAVLAVAGRPGSLTAVLRPAEGPGPSGFAAVGSDGTMSIAMRDLAPTTGDEVYEAWMIGSDGKPVALGGVKVGSAGTAFFTGAGVPSQPGLVLALTKEPGPGAQAPSSSPVSLGTAIAG